jgi:flagellar hook-basal body complex protein FliE
MPAPIAPIGVGSVGGFSLPSLTGTQQPSAPSSGGGFGKALSDELGKLEASQADATQKAQQLATGQATDVSAVVTAVERASLEIQLATQVRNKAVEAYQEIFRMQV